jgi:tetratricopeptide (TPR) repeat protein
MPNYRGTHTIGVPATNFSKTALITDGVRPARPFLPRRSRWTLPLLLGAVLSLSVIGAAGEDAPDVALPPASLAARIQALDLDAAGRDRLADAVQQRQYGVAEKILLDTAQLHPAAPTYALLGTVLFLDGRYLNAAIALKKADGLRSLDERDRFTLAMAYVAMDKRDWARQELDRLAASEARQALYPYWLSRLDYWDMRMNSAVANARKAIALDPTFMKAYDNLGLSYEGLGRNDEAILAYEKAIAMNRSRRLPSPWPPLNLGALLVKLGRLDEAEPYLQESLKYDARFPKAHYQMALLLDKRKAEDAALKELAAAVQNDPRYAEPHYLLGRIYTRRGETARAAEEWRTFHQLKEEHGPEP